MNSLSRIFAIIKREFKLGPRNPIFVLILVIPFLYTLVIQLLFGTFWQQKPVVATFQEKESVILELKKNEAVQIVEVKSKEEVKKIVEEKKADIGVIFPDDLEEKLADKEKVILEIYIKGDSLARDRTIAGVSIIEALRKLSPESPKVEFEEICLGEERALTILELLLPLIVLITVLSGAFILPASILVREKEKKTLGALLVSPASTTEILVAFGLLGIFLAVLMGVVVLILNIGFANPLLFLPLLLGSILMAEWGLVIALIVRSVNSLWANMKLFNLFIMAPAIIQLFPDWPQWTSKFFPAYYIINPVFRISIYSEGWGEIGFEILILALLAVIFFFPLPLLAKRLKKL